MTGSRPNAYWLFCWKFVSPIAMTGILVASVVDMIVSGAGYEVYCLIDPFLLSSNKLGPKCLISGVKSIGTMYCIC